MKKRIALCCAVVWLLVGCLLAACAAVKGQWVCPICEETVPDSMNGICLNCGWANNAAAGDGNHSAAPGLYLSDYPVYDYYDGPVIVSLGDSYSAGEGIPPFYGQYDTDGNAVPLKEKAADFDWLAHRSTLSWPGKLIFPGMAGTMNAYHNRNWYFVAASGATTEHISTGRKKRSVATMNRGNHGCTTSRA